MDVDDKNKEVPVSHQLGTFPMTNLTFTSGIYLYSFFKLFYIFFSCVIICVSCWKQAGTALQQPIQPFLLDCFQHL